MVGPTHRSKETLDLVRRVRTAAARRRRLRVLSACVGGTLAVCVVAIAVALTVSHSGQDLASGPSSTATSYASTTSTSATTTTSETTTTVADTTTIPVAVSSVTIPLSTTTTRSTTSTVHSGGYVVVIDPGHQAKADYSTEPVGPGSTEMKAKVSSGTRSVNTGTPESRLVLTVALKLQNSLETHGIKVVMTRTTQDVDISNMQRAQMANKAGADLFVRIHADGVSNESVNGILMLYPATIKGWTDDIAAQSKRAAQLVLDDMIKATGAKNRGLQARSDLTGFNWSDVPAILPEIGLMTNRAEDALLATDEYQDKIVQGLTDGILKYLGAS